MAGYKGYGYATVVELLSAALQQGNYLKMLTGIGEGGKKVPYHLGHFFLAIDTEAFVGAESFKKTAGDILRALRASTRAPGEDHIFTPARRSGTFGANAKTAACRLTTRCRRSFAQCATNWA